MDNRESMTKAQAALRVANGTFKATLRDVNGNTVGKAGLTGPNNPEKHWKAANR